MASNKSRGATAVDVDALSSRIDAAFESEDVSLDTLFEVLSNHYRRIALSYLQKRDEPVDVGELTYIVRKAGETETAPDRETMISEFHHVHLPKLDAAGLIEYDPENRSVVATERAAIAEPFLDLATRHR